MNNRTHILFDMDGTLLDTMPTYHQATRDTAEQIAIESARESMKTNPEVEKLLDPSFRETFIEMVLDQRYSEVQKKRKYAVLNDNDLKSKIPIYPEIPEVLKAFKEQGKKLFVVTKAEEDVAFHVLNQTGLSEYFDGIYGYTNDIGLTVSKVPIIDRAIKIHNIPIKQAVLIGDTHFDFNAAQSFNMPCIVALWGYSKKEDMEAIGATLFAKSPRDLLTADLA